MINGAHALISYPVGILADRIGKEIVLSISYGVFLVSTVIMLLSPSSVHAYVIAAVFGVYIGIVETVQKAVVPKYLANDLHGTTYGLYNMVIGFSFLGETLSFASCSTRQESRLRPRTGL